MRNGAAQRLGRYVVHKIMSHCWLPSSVPKKGFLSSSRVEYVSVIRFANPITTAYCDVLYTRTG